MRDEHIMNINFLTITANVGSLFEDLEGIEKTWIAEVLNVVKKQRAQFVAIHCQEIGGKDCNSSLDPIKSFYRKLVETDVMRDFNTVRAFVDGDVNNIDHYTALASIYFVHKSIREAKIFNFKTEKYNTASGKQFYINNLHKLPHIKKEKFQPSFAPDSKRSRKGHCRVRWKLYDKAIEFVNLHLYHDDSNLISFQSSPSPYTNYRKRALKHVLKRLSEDQPNENELYFIFGDFNFRLDVRAFVQSLCDSCQTEEIKSNSEKDEIVRIIFRKSESNGTPVESVNDKNDIIVTLEKKRFEMQNSLLQPTLIDKLRPFDLELPRLEEDLNEFDVSFPPTYPFSENVSDSEQYMKTRCPSWCDRILLSSSCWEWLQSQEGVKDFTYCSAGASVCVGDHKPVYLAFKATVGPENSKKTGFSALFQSCSIF